MFFGRDFLKRESTLHESGQNNYDDGPNKNWFVFFSKELEWWPPCDDAILVSWVRDLSEMDIVYDCRWYFAEFTPTHPAYNGSDNALIQSAYAYHTLKRCNLYRRERAEHGGTVVLCSLYNVFECDLLASLMTMSDICSQQVNICRVNKTTVEVYYLGIALVHLQLV